MSRAASTESAISSLSDGTREPSTVNSRLKMENTVEREIKVVMVGEAAVGKSSLTLRFVTSQFRDNVVTTIGASFLSKTIFVKQRTKFNIWDTAGQEKYRTLASLYYRGVDCAVVVYDITDRNSYEQVKKYWIDELLRQCDLQRQIKLCIAANKCDLHDKRVVSVEEGRALADHYNAAYFETSAKEDVNINEIFTALATMLPVQDTNQQTRKSDIYRLDTRPEKKAPCC